MAIIVAVRSGNWSDTSHVTGPWPGASTPTTKPGVGDTVQSGAFIVTIGEDVTVALIESTAASGYFVVTSAPALPAIRTITANILNSGTAGYALLISNPTGEIALTGNVTGGEGYGAYGIYNDNGTMGDVTGNVTGGAGEYAYGIYNNGGTIGDITGDQTGGAGESAWALYNNGGTIGDIIGDQTGGAGVMPGPSTTTTAR